MKTKTKVCPACRGNGYVRRGEEIAQCEECQSSGEVKENEQRNPS